MIEKQFFAISDRKTYAKRVSVWRGVQSVLFQTTFEKNPVAETSKELVLDSQDSLCYNFSFRGRRKWPPASPIKKAEEESRAIRL